MIISHEITKGTSTCNCKIWLAVKSGTYTDNCLVKHKPKSFNAKDHVTHNLAGLSRQHVIAKSSARNRWGFSFPLGSLKACWGDVRLEGRRLSRRHRRGWSRWSVHCCVSRRHCSRTTGERCFLWNNGLACHRSLASFNNVTPVSSKNCTSRPDKESTRTRRVQTGSWCPDLLPRQSHTHHFTRANVRKRLCVSIIVFLLTTFLVRRSTYIVTQ